MKFAIFVKNLGAPKWTLWASIDRQRLDKYVISIVAVSSCIVMEISTQKTDFSQTLQNIITNQSLCLRGKKWEFLKSIFSVFPNEATLPLITSAVCEKKPLNAEMNFMGISRFEIIG
ncbi:hypothetical protein T08_9307 [Trichinella sp. T8]|nr:hypothetical protein T08_9307 [Trichinella sp. T8]